MGLGIVLGLWLRLLISTCASSVFSVFLVLLAIVGATLLHLTVFSAIIVVLARATAISATSGFVTALLPGLLIAILRGKVINRCFNTTFLSCSFTLWGVAGLVGGTLRIGFLVSGVFLLVVRIRTIGLLLLSVGVLYSLLLICA